MVLVVTGLALGATTLSWRPVPAAAAPDDAGSITGKVLGTGGAGLANVCVYVSDGSSTTTDVNGDYTVDGIAAGGWEVQFVDCNPEPTYVGEWYESKLDKSQADKVVVTAGEVTALNTVQLDLGVVISGTVTDADGNGLGGINVNANPYDSGPQSAGSQTDANGTYRLTPLPAGQYRVQFYDSAGVWATQYWHDKPSWNTATRLDLDAGVTPDPVDATMRGAASITGTVTAADGGAPVAGICVNAQTPANGWFDWLSGVTTDSYGQYTIGGLPSDVDIRLQFHDCNADPTFLDQWYDDQVDGRQSTPISLAPGDLVPIDAQLRSGVRVGGTVTNRLGTPLAGISVNIFSDDGQGGYAQTDANGHYRASPVGNGAYRVQFRDDAAQHYATQFWDGQISYNAATLLSVSTSAPWPDDIDAVLDVGASVTGTVTAPDGSPVERECVTLVIQGPNGPDGLAQVQTDNQGRYRFSGVAATTVWVMFQDCNGDDGAYQTVFWQSAAQLDQATPIAITAGAAITDVDQQLALAGLIRGHVTDVDGAPLAGICVQAVTATAFGNMTGTDEHGNYQLVLSVADDYTVQFVHCDREHPRYVGQTYATPVPVEPGETVDGVDAVLLEGPPASLSGSVRNAAGAAISDGCVVVFLANQFPLFTSVAADGTFTVENIPSGTYALAFGTAATPQDCQVGNIEQTVTDPLDPAITYAPQWWHGVDLQLDTATGPDPIAQGATLVAIGAGAALTGFDQCFGCVPPPPPTTSTTTSTVPSTVATVSIEVTGVRRGPGTITLAYAADTVLAASAAHAQAVPAGTVFTATCSSTAGPTGIASGTGLALTVGGVADRAAYSCTVVASVGGVTVGMSAVELVAPMGASLPATGTDVDGAAPIAVLVLLGGVALVLVARRRPLSAAARAARRGRT